MFGFLNVYKPEGMTSHDVVYRVRKIFNIKKVGHAGTLDPMAQGVLPIGVGNATRLFDYLPNQKEYIAELKFGYISDTYDSEGKIEKFSDVRIYADDAAKALCDFEGDISQKPPIYSAVKVNGKKLYDYARKGIETKIPERIIHVDKIELLDFNRGENTAKIIVNCSKGTYIRSIIHDLGLKLKAGAYMTALTRTLSSGMTVDNSVNIEEITLSSLILPEKILNFPVIEISTDQFQKVKNGNPADVGCNDGLAFLKYNDKIISLANVSDGTAYSRKVFVC